MDEKGVKKMVRTRKPITKTILILGMIMLVGAVLRILCCFWGYPYQLHPDEGTIVNNAIDIIARHSFEPNVYNRPDHFEIKCNAVIFTIVSHFRYGCSAAEAFAQHAPVFYLLARGFTAVWGTLMIPLAYLICEKLKKNSGVIAATVVALFPVFIRDSAYATPDIPLTFFLMLLMYTLMLYMEKPSLIKLSLVCLEIAISITIKYTAAIFSLPVAAIVIVDNVRKKTYMEILKIGALCVGLTFVMCFFLAPNLFTNISQTIATLKFEARNTHLGADNLGIVGNFFFYLKIFLYNGGIELFLFSILGVTALVRERNYIGLPLLAGLIFWICTSCLALHWERWGMPIYITPVLLAAVGMTWIFEIICGWKVGRWRKAAKAFFGTFTVIVGANLLLGVADTVTFKLAKQGQIESISFCKENGITTDNSIYEGYSPLYVYGPFYLNISLDSEGNLVFPDDKKNAEYIVLSSNIYGRYYAEPERYTGQIAVYEKIREQYPLIYENHTVQETRSMSGILNSFCSIKNLQQKAEGRNCGYSIIIYRIV